MRFYKAVTLRFYGVVMRATRQRPGTAIKDGRAYRISRWAQDRSEALRTPKLPKESYMNLSELTDPADRELRYQQMFREQIRSTHACGERLRHLAHLVTRHLDGENVNDEFEEAVHAVFGRV